MQHGGSAGGRRDGRTVRHWELWTPPNYVSLELVELVVQEQLLGGLMDVGVDDEAPQ